MSTDQGGDEQLGRLDDSAEEQEPSSTTGGAAAEGRYDPGQGSPTGTHPVGEGHPDEATRYDEDERRRTEQPE